MSAAGDGSSRVLLAAAAVLTALATCWLFDGASRTPDEGGSLLVPTTRGLPPCTAHQPANGTSRSVLAAG